MKKTLHSSIPAMRLLGLALLLLLASTVQAAAQDDAKAPFKCGPKAARQQALKAPQHADAVPEGMTEYTLSGYSCFKYNESEDDYENVYRYGGNYVTYPVYVKIDQQAGKAYLHGLVDSRQTMPLTDVPDVEGTYDASAHTITIASPANGKVEDHPIVGTYTRESGSSYTMRLVSGEVYGIGYWRNSDNLVLTVSDDLKRLTPQSHFSVVYTYEDDEDGWSVLYNGQVYYDVIFNSTLYQNAEGINVLCSEDAPTLAAFPGHTVSHEVALFNAGTTATDFAIQSDLDAFSFSPASGSIAAGGRQMVTVSFKPTEQKTYTGTLSVFTDADEPLTLPLTGTVMTLPDYSALVSEGADCIKFDTDDAYPWLMTDTITGSPVAVSTNKGKDNTKSSLTVKVTVPDGHLGTLNFAGHYDPWFSVSSNSETFTVSSNGEQCYKGTVESKDFDQTLRLGSGEHELTFAYEKGNSVTGMFTPGKDLTYLSSIGLKLEKLDDYKLTATAMQADFSRVFIDKEPVSGSKEALFLKNEGSKAITIQSIEGDGVFFGTLPETTTIASLDSIAITLGYKVTQAGDYSGKVTIKTNAGNAVVSCSVAVDQLPDFQSIVKEGEFTFTTDPDFPFAVENGVAYNTTAQVVDTEETWCTFDATFTVPAGKYGVLTWKGLNDSQTGYEEWGLITDGTMIYMDAQTPAMVGGRQKDASHRIMNPEEVYLTAGKHTVTFQYYQCGDGVFVGDDKVEISDLSLVLKDANSEVLTVWTEASFDTTYVGKTAASSMTIFNLQSDNLTINSISTEGDFTATADTEHSVSSFSTGTIEVAFAPTKAGLCQGAVVLATSAGTVSIPVEGFALDASNLLLLSDFEEKDHGWTFINDDDCGSKFRRTTNSAYAHHGSAALLSTSGDNCSNYAVSPAFTVPAEGATLTYYVRSNTQNDEPLQTYDVLAGEGTDPKTFTSLYSEAVGAATIVSGKAVYQKHTIDLAQFAGKTISVCFWHHDETTAFWLLFDDVTVEKLTATGIVSVAAGETRSVVFYNAEGVASTTPFKGLNIVRTTYSDGRVSVSKVLSK